MRWPHLDNYGKWRRWWAWYPVRVKDDWIWCEYVKRREYETWGGSGWEYDEMD